MTKRLEVKVYGRVQMVMFRDFISRNAKKLKLVGFVRNENNGIVFAVAEGGEESLKLWLAKLHRGPLFANVKHVEEAWGEPKNEFTNFEIRYE